MNQKKIALMTTLLLLSGCVHEDQSRLTPPGSSATIYGVINIMGQEREIEISYNSTDGMAGPDGVIFTGDDNVLYYSTFSDGERLNQTRYNFFDAGDDKVWFTEDDIISSAEVPIVEDGVVVGVTTLGDAGEDGVWHTEDDHVSSYTRYEDDTDINNNKVTYEKRYTGTGDDGLWFTPDDQLSSQRETYIDAQGREISCTTVFDAYIGNSGVIADTFVSCEKTLKIDEEENITYQLQYSSSAGSDADVNNGILAVLDIDLEKLSGFGNDVEVPLRTYNIYSGRGEDGQWLTEDDVLPHKESTEIVSRSNKEVIARHVSTVAGDNGVYGDEDDEMKYYTLIVLTLDEEKYTGHWTAYESPGKDGEWFTADDVKNGQYIEYHFLK